MKPSVNLSPTLSAPRSLPVSAWGVLLRVLAGAVLALSAALPARAQTGGLSTSGLGGLPLPPGPPAIINQVSGDGQSTGAGTAFANPLVVEVRDAANNLLAGATVDFSGTGFSFSGDTATDINGRATVVATPTRAGILQVTATTYDGDKLPVTVTFNALECRAGDPAQLLVVRGAGQSSPPGTPFPKPVQALITDGYGNPLAGQSVTFMGPDLAYAPADGSPTPIFLSQATVSSASNGLATVLAKPLAAGLLVGKAFSSSPDVPAALFSETGTVQPARIVVFKGDGQQSAVGSPFPTFLTVQALDADGNPLQDIAVTFSGDGLSFSTTSAYTDADGYAGVEATPTQVGSMTATASVSNGDLTVTFSSLTGLKSAPATLAFTQGQEQSSQLNIPFPQPLQVVVKDVYDNPVPGAYVTFSGSGLQFSAIQVPTDDAGVATTLATPVALGDLTVQATVGLLTASCLEFGQAVQASQLKIVSGDGQSGPIGKPLANPVVVLALDGSGLPLAGATLNLSPSPGLTFAGNPTTGSDGKATFSVTPTQIGTWESSVFMGASKEATKAYFTATGTDLPAAIAVVSGANQSAPVGTAFALPLTVLVTGSLGEPMQGVTVNFAASAGVTLSSPTASTGSDGQASITATPSAGGDLMVTASVSGLASTASFPETGVIPTTATPAFIRVVSGAHQRALVGTPFAQPLVVLITDRRGRPVPNVTVTFQGQGFGFSPATTAVTGRTGLASITTKPTAYGRLIATASVQGVSRRAIFRERGIRSPERPSRDSDCDEDRDSD